MRRSASTSFSFVAMVVFLFLLLLVFVLILTNQFMYDFLQKQESLSLPVILLSAVFIVVLLAILGLNAFRLAQDVHNNVFGVRFKLRLVLFFMAVTLLSSMPTMILTANLLRNVFDVWFVRDTTNSLEFGATMSTRYYSEKTNGLMSLTTSEVLPGLLKGVLDDPERVFRRIKELNNDLAALQIFSPGNQVNPRVLASVGDQRLWLQVQDLKYVLADQVNKMTVDNLLVLRTVSNQVAGRGLEPLRVVLSVRLPDDYGDGSILIGATQRNLIQFIRLPVSFPLIAFGVYMLFFMPMLLIALMISFYLADEVIRPLVQLEQAVNRVAQGDYSTRLLSRKSDTMSHFVASFNEMVGELEHSRNDLKQSERLQTWQDIAQRMAHEIKNPLTPIKLSAERILRKYQQSSEDFPRILSEGVGTIIQEVGAISGLLTEFRDFARLPQPVLGEVNLRDLVHNTWLMYEGNPQVRLDTEALASDLAVRLDRGQMMQVLKNLFQNAIDAIGPEGGSIFVRSFSINRMGQHVARIQIQDTGCGVEAEKLREIFSPYFTTKKHGSGLGLAIVEKIILDHGGRIWAESQPGQGTSFFMDLPAYKPTGEQ